VVTDNRNRAVAEVRHVFNKQGGNMAESGAVAWQFARKGYILIEDEFEQDDIFLTAADAGADDVRFDDDIAEIFTEIDDLQNVRGVLEEAGFRLSEVSVIYDPNNPLALETAATIQVMKLVESLEDLDDVQNVYSSLEITNEAMVALESV
jgi:transcriptional/translational regulatory protein YebC/TACO1